VSGVAAALATAEIVDLSLTIDERLPCTWPNNMPFEHNVENWYVPVDKEGSAQQPLRSVAPFYTAWMTMHEHIATHFDAPPHYIPPPDSGLPHANANGLRYGDRVPIGDMQGPAVVFDAAALRDAGEPGVSPVIAAAEVEAWEAEQGRVEPADVVLLRTGWDAYYVPYPDGGRYARHVFERRAAGWPAFSPEAVELFHRRGVRTIGMDTPTIGAAHDPNPAHWAGLQHGMNVVEGLANLGALPVRGAYFVFVPVKIAFSSGAPGRAFAYV
jgi:kynurenine formamidase